jgi:hypothetical protein
MPTFPSEHWSQQLIDARRHLSAAQAEVFVEATLLGMPDTVLEAFADTLDASQATPGRPDVTDIDALRALCDAHPVAGPQRLLGLDAAVRLVDRPFCRFCGLAPVRHHGDYCSSECKHQDDRREDEVNDHVNGRD